MIKPTVGRVVWFYSGTAHPMAEQQPMAAIIVKVLDDHCINITRFNEVGDAKGYISVPLIQENENAPAIGFYCTWMPYQLGQAAKTEQAECKAVQETIGGIGMASSYLAPARNY
jgi:hypothetical protein